MIEVTEWLTLFALEYRIALPSAQYVNIWDPVDNKYTDIASLRSFPIINLRAASPIYIRYIPLQEIAFPPHASYLSMIDDA